VCWRKKLIGKFHFRHVGSISHSHELTFVLSFVIVIVKEQILIDLRLGYLLFGFWPVEEYNNIQFIELCNRVWRRQKNQFKISFTVTPVLFVAFLYTKNHFGVKFVSFFVILSQFLLNNTCLAFSNRLCNSS